MTLFDILSNDQRVLVYSDAGAMCLYTWNRSLTLQAWMKNTTGMYLLDPPADSWEEVECQTLSECPKSYEEARKRAIEWSNS